MLLKSPRLIILDEATADLDSETEVLVQQALAEALTNRTSLVIAHGSQRSRPPTRSWSSTTAASCSAARTNNSSRAGDSYAELYETQYSRLPADPVPDATRLVT